MGGLLTNSFCNNKFRPFRSGPIRSEKPTQTSLGTCLSNFARIGRTDAEKSKENERPPFPYRRPPLPSADELMELAKSTKSGVDEKFATSSAPGNKRASINVKGLTVNIPATAAQVSNASLPLSPAQERWVSMSGQQSVTPVSKSNESLPCTAKIGGLDENGLEKRQMATQCGREDDLSAAIDDSAAFL
uniref:Uncharacterized protein n=1 Tax=Caenorhabditis japonica TaxID=281687 RepID=A0A8R1EQ59_CAEJA